jgi:hypothetical protein
VCAFYLFKLLNAKCHQIATACAFSRGGCEVTGTAVTAVSGGPPHSRKYDFLDIVKTGLTMFSGTQPTQLENSITYGLFRYFKTLLT